MTNCLQDNKQCLGDDVLPDGSSVSKGDIVFYGVRALGRMEYLWGEDAEAFRPERRLDDNGVKVLATTPRPQSARCAFILGRREHRVQ